MARDPARSVVGHEAIDQRQPSSAVVPDASGDAEIELGAGNVVRDRAVDKSDHVTVDTPDGARLVASHRGMIEYQIAFGENAAADDLRLAFSNR